MKPLLTLSALLIAVSLVAGQTAATPDQTPGVKGLGLTEPSPLSVHHSLSFGMSSGGGSSSLQSQSFYSTMLQYRFSAPVTLNLNFSLPLYSSYSPYQNLSTKNMQSLDYFKSVPFDVSLNWKPSDRFQFNFAVVNYPTYGYGYGMNNFSAMPWMDWSARR